MTLALLFTACGNGSSSSDSTNNSSTTGSSGSGSTSGSGSSSGSGPGSSSGSGSASGSGNGTSGTASSSGNNTTGTATPSSSTVALATDVLMHHNDLARTGQMLAETTLTLSNVNSALFGKVAFLAADGKVDGQPLSVTSLSINGTTHNVIYVVSEHNSVYAYDADNQALLWQVSLTGANETPSDDRGCGDITPEIGITSTPVIDRNRGPHGVLYAVAMTKDASGGIHHRLHALDLANGAELFGGPSEIAATYPGTGGNSVNGVLTFDPSLHTERAALTLVNGNIYMGWTAHCMAGPYTGWIMSYSADTLKQTGVVNIAPNGHQGSVWMAGSGMASDGASIYVVDGNGTFGTTLDANGFPVDSNFGDSFMKLSTSPLKITDYFAPLDVVQLANNDNDFGSGGAMLLPDQKTADGSVKHLAVAAGKDNKIYVVDRDSMGKFSPTSNNIWQVLTGTLAGGIWGSPAYFNGTVYFGGLNDSIKALPVTNAMLAATAASKSPTTFAYPGTVPAISANGTSNAILWAAENGTTGALHAYDATNLARELYNSNQAGTRDQWGAGNKFITPMISRGKVYVGATNGVAVFGLRQ
nr:PQQ-binding-like beta-propeller repeat protein [Paraburkholderia diazotrophica]